MSNSKSKKRLALLELNDQELVSIYCALVDIICSMREFCAIPGHDTEQSIFAAQQLKEYVPIQQKLKKYFDDANIKVTLPNEDKNSLTLLGIHKDF